MGDFDASVITYTIIQADGLYPVGISNSAYAFSLPLHMSEWSWDFTLLPLLHLLTNKPLKDNTIEEEIFAPQSGQNYKIEYHQTNLWPDGASEKKPWTEIPPELRNKVNGINVLKLSFTEQDLELFPNLKVICRMGVGYDRLDRTALAKRNVIVCNVPDYGTAEIADHAIGLMLSMRRGILLHNDRQRASPPDPVSLNSYN